MATKTIVKQVKTGDFVDACAMNGKWLAAEVIDVSISRDIRVHFLGHRGDEDETIPVGQVANRITTLYTHTPNRCDWEVSGNVDYLCSVEYGVWTPVRISAIDSTKNRVMLSVSQKEIEDALRAAGAPQSAAKVVKSVWVNICSDHVAPLGTHTYNAGNKNKRARTDTAGNYSSPAVPTPAALPTPDPTWLAPHLRAREVSDAHIEHCEQALVRDEGFTTPALFAAVPAKELTEYLKGLGITARGVQLNLVEVHNALQPKSGEGAQAKFAIKVA